MPGNEPTISCSIALPAVIKSYFLKIGVLVLGHIIIDIMNRYLRRQHHPN